MPLNLLPVFLTSTSITLAVAAFIHGWRQDRKLVQPDISGAPEALVPLWKRASAAGGIPTAVTLIVCSLKPDWLASIPGLNMPIALGGLSLLYVCLEALVPRQKKPPCSAPKTS